MLAKLTEKLEDSCDESESSLKQSDSEEKRKKEKSISVIDDIQKFESSMSQLND